jgi:uncharacterized protein
MRSLLDINVLIALLDPDHVFHERAHGWWDEHHGEGWASCPFTENGVVRIMSNPNYSPKVRLSPGELIGHLRGFADRTDHEFWADNISILDDKIFAADHILRSRTITDVYLLALATARRARLATFDQGIALAAVEGAKRTNLIAI